MGLKTKNKILHKIFNDSVVKNRVPFTVLLDGKEGYGVKVTLGNCSIKDFTVYPVFHIKF